MASILCPNCHTPNQPAAKFCRVCGKPLASPGTPTLPTQAPGMIACPSCGRPNRLGAKFCTSCGHALQAAFPVPPPAPPSPIPSSVNVNIQGDLSGQMVIGNNNFQYQVKIGTIEAGAEVNLPPAPIPAPRPVQTPVHILPADFPDLLGRKTEIDQVTNAIQSGKPVEFSGEDGIGKTTLLQFLANHLDNQPDGVVWDAIPGQPVEDVLQFLYGKFYTSDIIYHPSSTQVHQGLQGKHALVVLDDVSDTRQEVERLLDTAPGCAFIMASAERRLWRNGQAITLKGLNPQEALPLVERELGRPLSPNEQSAALALCTAYDGHPLKILQAVYRAVNSGVNLPEAARQSQVQAQPQISEDQALSRLSNVERRVVSAMAFLGKIPLGVSHLAEVTGLANVAHVLNSLQNRHLAQSHSPRYSLTGNLSILLQQQEDLTVWGERYLDYFTSWAGRQSTATPIVEESAALLKVLEWAASAGLWTKTLTLVKAIEAALALGLCWGTWVQALELGLQAARLLGDRSAEGWALHQMGTQSLCTGQVEAARNALTSALQIRQALGDQTAIAVTKHNLDLLAGPFSPPRKSSKSPPKTGRIVITVIAVAAVAMAGFWAWDYFCREGGCRWPTPVPQITEQPPPTTVPPLEPTFTPYPSPTSPPTELPPPPPSEVPPPPTTPPLQLADLVVINFQVSSTPWYQSSQDAIMIPVQIVIENKGTVPADPFKMGVTANPDGSPPAHIVTPAGEEKILFSQEPLAPERSISFDAVVIVSGALQGQTISLTAVADFCSDETGINQQHCRVAETSEDNNTATIHNLALPIKPIPIACVTFDDPELSPGSEYRVNQTITSQGVTLSIQPFTWSSGTPTSNGMALLDSQQALNNQALFLNNVNLAYPIVDPLQALTLDYYYQGGNINIQINGERHPEFKDPRDMDGVTIQGVTIAVSIDVDNIGKGFIQLDGKITEFSIGGQEFWVDNICPKVP
jgi:hypothetical protein